MAALGDVFGGGAPPQQQDNVFKQDALNEPNPLAPENLDNLGLNMGLDELQAPVEDSYEPMQEEEVHEFKSRYPDTFSQKQTVSLGDQSLDLGDSCANPS